MTRFKTWIRTGTALVLCATGAYGVERQITGSPKNHNLDNNDNFSPDGKFLVYDTRETFGPGIENSQTIEKVEVLTGQETILYQPGRTILGWEDAAPGVGAASHSFTEDAVIFIHGPLVPQVDERGFYSKTNRNGAMVPGDGSGILTWLDYRDVDTTRPTKPGAHRGGTHRHEFTRMGNRIGFTYDDHLLPEYDRTIGYLEPHPNAPGGASHYFAILVPVAKRETAKPGEIEKAYGDSWADPAGAMRAFIGKVKQDDNETYEESLFVVDVPTSVDITTADSGDANRFPSPPEGVSVRRLTHTWAGGIVRGSPSGGRIAYYAHDERGKPQIFIIPANGSDRAEDPALRPVQATHLPAGAGPGLRWHPSGEYVACISNNAVAVIALTGPHRGEHIFLTDQNPENERINLVWSPDGRRLAFNRLSPHPSRAKAYNNENFLQIFSVYFDENLFNELINE